VLVPVPVLLLLLLVPVLLVPVPLRVVLVPLLVALLLVLLAAWLLFTTNWSRVFPDKAACGPFKVLLLEALPAVNAVTATRRTSARGHAQAAAGNLNDCVICFIYTWYCWSAIDSTNVGTSEQNQLISLLKTAAALLSTCCSTIHCDVSYM
jgi:hypothetical protein